MVELQGVKSFFWWGRAEALGLAKGRWVTDRGRQCVGKTYAKPTIFENKGGAGVFGERDGKANRSGQGGGKDGAVAGDGKGESRLVKVNQGMVFVGSQGNGMVKFGARFRETFLYLGTSWSIIIADLFLV